MIFERVSSTFSQSYDGISSYQLWTTCSKLNSNALFLKIDLICEFFIWIVLCMHTARWHLIIQHKIDSFNKSIISIWCYVISLKPIKCWQQNWFFILKIFIYSIGKYLIKWNFQSNETYTWSNESHQLYWIDNNSIGKQ